MVRFMEMMFEVLARFGSTPRMLTQGADLSLDFLHQSDRESFPLRLTLDLQTPGKVNSQSRRSLVLHALAALSAPPHYVAHQQDDEVADRASSRSDLMNPCSRTRVTAALHDVVVAVATVDAKDTSLDLGGQVEVVHLREGDMDRAQRNLDQSFDSAWTAFGPLSLLGKEDAMTNPKGHGSKCHVLEGVTQTGNENDTALGESAMGKLARQPASVTAKRRGTLARDVFGRIRFMFSLHLSEQDRARFDQLMEAGTVEGALDRLYSAMEPDQGATLPGHSHVRSARLPAARDAAGRGAVPWLCTRDAAAMRHVQESDGRFCNRGGLVVYDRLAMTPQERTVRALGPCSPAHPPAYHCGASTTTRGTQPWYDHLYLSTPGSTVRTLAQLRGVLSVHDDPSRKWLLVNEYVPFEARDAVVAAPLIRRRRRKKDIVPGRGLRDVLRVVDASHLIGPAFVVKEPFDPVLFSQEIAPYAAWAKFDPLYPGLWWVGEGKQD